MQHRNLILPVFLPTLLVLACFGLPGLESTPHYEEAFGSGNYFMSLRFPRDPELTRGRGEPSDFRGELVTTQGEMQVTGRREKHADRWVYKISTTQGEWTGMLSESAQCPRWIDLFPARGLAHKPERLQAGECPSL
ncbi:hypothetical protein K2X33_07585 [bacterium]|nr:hypothetical protein [bacterium]